jgi:hypothetical protein
MAYIEAPHLREWIDARRAFVVSPTITASFGEYLESLPWHESGLRLDWSALESSSSALDRPSLLGWVRQHRIGKHQHVVVMYSPDEPGLLCSLRDAVENIDFLFLRAPGCRYLCGAEVNHDVVHPVFEDFMEFDGAETLTVRA